MNVQARLGRWRHQAELASFRRRYDWQQPPARGETTLVAFYNGIWGRRPAWLDVPPPAGCEISLDRRRLHEAAAVVFHLPSLGSLRGVRKFPGQLWVATSMECDAHYPRQRDLEFMAQFDLRLGYWSDADVRMPYVHSDMEPLLRARPRPKSDARLAALFVSGRHDQSGRLEYAAGLMRHMEVHSFGKRLRNRRLPLDAGPGSKIEAIAGYKFTLAFENARAPDYVTEKLYEPLIAGSVPVYLGAPNVAAFAPGDRCYIDISDFSGPEELARYLRDMSDDEYEAHLAWKERPFRQDFLDLIEVQRVPAVVRLCERVRELRGDG